MADLAGLRYDQYKAVFMEQPAHGLEVWMQPLVRLRAPKLFNLRTDPFERAEHEAGDYVKWFVEHCSSWFLHRRSWRSISQRFRSFRRGRSRAVFDRPGHGNADEAKEQQLASTSRL